MAPGISVLYEAVRDFGDVTVVAPDGERSAVSHALTLDRSIQVRKVNTGTFEGIAVSGTPADCVKIALNEFLEDKPDLILSGINLGSNAGLNVVYSGTVGAAAEGTFNGIPAIALSINTYHDPYWEPVIPFIKDLVRNVIENGIPKGILLNINIPNVAHKSQIKGVKITEQGMAHWKEEFDKRVDPKGRIYYWMTGVKREEKEDERIDDTALKNNYISVTPVQYNMTAFDRLEEIKNMGLSYQNK